MQYLSLFIFFQVFKLVLGNRLDYNSTNTTIPINDFKSNEFGSGEVIGIIIAFICGGIVLVGLIFSITKFFKCICCPDHKNNEVSDYDNYLSENS